MALHRQHLEVEEIGDITVVNFTDKNLNEWDIQIIGQRLFGLVNEQGKKNILLDFTNVEYLPTAGLGKLIILNDKVINAGGKLVICSAPPNICKIFEIVRLNKLIQIVEHQQEGLLVF